MAADKFAFLFEGTEEEQKRKLCDAAQGLARLLFSAQEEFAEAVLRGSIVEQHAAHDKINKLVEASKNLRSDSRLKELEQREKKQEDEARVRRFLEALS